MSDFVVAKEMLTRVKGEDGLEVEEDEDFVLGYGKRRQDYKRGKTIKVDGGYIGFVACFFFNEAGTLVDLQSWEE